MRRLIGATEVWSRRWLDCGGGKVERVEQVVQALPIVWFPRNREKMKKKKEKRLAPTNPNRWSRWEFLFIIIIFFGHF